MQQTNKLKKISIILLGDAKVGKTSWLKSIAGEDFDEDEQSTVGLEYDCISYNNRKFQFWDTAGQKKFRTMVDRYIKDSDIVILFYDSTNKVSLTNLDNIYAQRIKENDPENKSKIIVIGTKNDLEDKKKVSQEEVESKINEIALKLKRQPADIASFEMSAKNKACELSASDFKDKLSSMFPAPLNNGLSKIYPENDGEADVRCGDTPLVKGFFIIFGGVVGFLGGYSVGQYIFQGSGWISAGLGVFLGWLCVSWGYGYYHSCQDKATDEKDDMIVIDEVKMDSISRATGDSKCITVSPGSHH